MLSPDEIAAATEGAAEVATQAVNASSGSGELWAALIGALVGAIVAAFGSWWGAREVAMAMARRQNNEAVVAQLVRAHSRLSETRQPEPLIAELDEITRALLALRIGHKASAALFQTSVEISEIAEAVFKVVGMRKAFEASIAGASRGLAELAEGNFVRFEADNLRSALVVRDRMMARHPDVFANWDETLRAIRSELDAAVNEAREKARAAGPSERAPGTRSSAQASATPPTNDAATSSASSNSNPT
jgi:hypothetical protein